VVIGANLGEFGNVRLDQSPIKGITGTNNNHRWASTANAVEMNSVPACVNEFSEWGMILSIGRRYREDPD
jgi:hypothetical protein